MYTVCSHFSSVENEGAVEMAQSVQRLSDFRSSDPIQRAGCCVILHTCDPSTGKVETGGSLELVGWLIVKWN